jgi:threonine/homoserine/homoserine lactone efflux protein
MEFIAPVLVFALIAAITPGPNNIMIMSSGVNFGVRRSIPHLLGISFGFTGMMIAIGFGVGYLFIEYPYIHEVIKVFGILYLLFLAWRIATSTPNSSNKESARPISFIEAALFQWVNPKAWVMGTTALATFTTGGSDIEIQIALIIFIFFMTTWPSVSIWLFCGVALQSVLSHPRHYRIFNAIMGLMLAASIYPIVSELYADYLG